MKRFCIFPLLLIIPVITLTSCAKHSSGGLVNEELESAYVSTEETSALIESSTQYTTYSEETPSETSINESPYKIVVADCAPIFSFASDAPIDESSAIGFLYKDDIVEFIRRVGNLYTMISYDNDEGIGYILNDQIIDIDIADIPVETKFENYEYESGSETISSEPINYTETLSGEEMSEAYISDTVLSDYYGEYSYYTDYTFPTATITIEPVPENDSLAHIYYEYLDPYKGSEFIDTYITAKNISNNILIVAFRYSSGINIYKARMSMDFSQSAFAYIVIDNTMDYGAFPTKTISGGFTSAGL